MASSSFQLVVIGGGPGGYVAAIRAAQLGLTVALIEKSKTLGGTCLNIGCIPSKALLASTEHFHFAKERFASHGITAKGLEMDVAAMMKRKDGVVSGLTKGIDFLVKKNKIERFLGTGRLVDAKTVEVVQEGEKTTLAAEHILLATGSVPVELPFLKFNRETVVSSDQAIAFDRVPKRLLVIGAGAIGLELGSVWSRLGSQVTVVEFLPRIAPGFDNEVAGVLQKSLTKQGITFHLNTKVESAKIEKNEVTVTASQDGKSIEFKADKVLVAVGRRPFMEGLGLEAVGVKLTPRGRIQIDDHWRTTVSSISAIGDVVEGPMLAHKAEEEGVACVEQLAGKPGHVNYALIPGVVYTSPEGAGVGLTEEEAKEKKIPYRAGKFSFQANGRAIANDTTEGFAKVLADPNTDRVLGVHLVASNASELIAEAVLLMEFGGSAEDLGRTVHAHPTMSETLKEAGLAVEGRAIHS